MLSEQHIEQELFNHEEGLFCCAVGCCEVAIVCIDRFKVVTDYYLLVWLSNFKHTCGTLSRQAVRLQQFDMLLSQRIEMSQDLIFGSPKLQRKQNRMIKLILPGGSKNKSCLNLLGVAMLMWLSMKVIQKEIKSRQSSGFTGMPTHYRNI